MKRLLLYTLGMFSAIGGLVDFGEIVANGAVGVRFGLVWAVVVGVCVFAEMSGRVIAVSGSRSTDLSATIGERRDEVDERRTCASPATGTTCPACPASMRHKDDARSHRVGARAVH